MFEGWVLDLLASYLGRFIDLQKDKLRISLWSGTTLREQLCNTLELVTGL